MQIAVGFDYGVAVFPDEGDRRDVLIRIADERLYEMKQLNRTTRQSQPSAPAPAPRRPTESPAAPAAPVPPERGRAEPTRAERRKSERVPLAGTQAYAQLTDDPQRTALVIDLGYGGLAMGMGSIEKGDTTFCVVVHVPAPPVRVSLKQIYEVLSPSGQIRVGCAFVI